MIKYNRTEMKSTPSASTLVSPTAGLEPYTGNWNFDMAAHLLRRTTYGATHSEIRSAANSSMEETVELLLADKALPDEPINFYYADDSLVPIGQSWIDKPYADNDDRNKVLRSRRASLAGWTLGNLIDDGIHIREKMTLFWNNHFVTQASVLQDPNLIYHNINILRKGSLGNFKALLDEVTISPAMLRYLNGNQNSKQAPNENFARELLELFTVGKGPLAGSGDYTTFTEHDVFEAAKVLTGWRDRGYYVREGQAPGSYFTSGRHDKSIKILSHRFENIDIFNNEDVEYKNLLEIILAQDSVALHLSRKLYRWFVYYDITPEIESSIIEPMAEILRSSNYEIKPVLQSLLSSSHFYEICSVGPMIKNPMDFLVNILRQFEISFPTNKIQKYEVWVAFLRAIEAFQMDYYEPPNVAGWKAYYQEPLYYRTWITAATLPVRQAYTNVLAASLIEINNFQFGINILDYISRFENPQNPNSLIEEFVAYHLPQPLSENQLVFLKEILIPGLPDFEWTIEYNNYLSSPNDEEIKLSVERKLRSFLIAFLNLAEYNLQ